MGRDRRHNRPFAGLELGLFGLLAFSISTFEGVAVGALGALALLVLWRHPPGLPRGLAERWFAIGFVGWVVIGLAVGMTSDTPPRASQLNKAMMIAALPVGYRLTTLPDRARRIIVVCLIAGLLLTSVAGLWQIYAGTFPGQELFRKAEGYQGQLYKPGTSEPVASGLFRNRLKTAKALLLGIAALAAAWPLRHRPLAKLLLAALPLAVGMLALTHVRALLVVVPASLAALFLLLVSSRLRRSIAWVYALALSSAFGAVVTAGATAFSWQTVPATDTWTIRRWIWAHALRVFVDAPALGSGLGTYPKVSRRVFPEGETHVHTLGAHCQHLTALAEGGLVGFAFWATLWVGIALALHELWQARLESAHAQGVRLFATCFILAASTMSLVHDVFFQPLGAAMFWFAVGAALALGRHARTTLVQPSATF